MSGGSSVNELPLNSHEKSKSELVKDYKIDYIKYLNYPGATTNIMDITAQNGNLDMLIWLHEHRKEGCSTWAMDWAAVNGHLEVVKWLHKNNKIGTYRTTLWALENGHVHILDYLKEEKILDFTICTTSLLKYIVNYSADDINTDLIDWLYINHNYFDDSDDFESLLLETILETNNWNLLQWYNKKYVPNSINTFYNYFLFINKRMGEFKNKLGRLFLH